MKNFVITTQSKFCCFPPKLLTTHFTLVLKFNPYIQGIYFDTHKNGQPQHREYVVSTQIFVISIKF